MLRITFIPLLALFAGSSHLVYGQSLVSQNASIKPLQELYVQELGNSSRIFSGAEYATRYRDVVDHQFFTYDWEPGSIRFQGQEFDQLDLRYDIVSDLVLVKYFDPKDGRMVAIKPAQQKVESFEIMSFQFARLGPEVTLDSKPGYYEVLLNKEYKLYARHWKERFVDKSRGEAVVGFDHKTRIYLLKDGKFTHIRNFGSLLEEFEDKKKELRIYARSQNMIWKSNSRRNAVLIVKQYMALKNGQGE